MPVDPAILGEVRVAVLNEGEVAEGDPEKGNGRRGALLQDLL